MKKILYVPGMISALLIPAVFWFYGSQSIKKTYTVMDLGLPAKIKKGVENAPDSFESVRHWKYKKIMVRPNTALQHRAYYVSELKKLQAGKRKETGIEFVIGDQNNYQDIIALLDAMKLAKQEYYGIDMEQTHHLFAVQGYTDPATIYENTIGRCGTRYVTDYYTENDRGFDYMKSVTDLPVQAYYIIFGFLLFLNISMLSIRENFQIKRSLA
ncbi:hypothetical protein [uncultured Chryseobacterium sp.]|uniref:hypothetical protein n=1 Tax=uncultured Chryseobacterium sp. TaxID=259322 RepID=UPI0025DBD723|nr:hypothetical protein [uncultured Chryseobacterium sp.]